MVIKERIIIESAGDVTKTTTACEQN